VCPQAWEEGSIRPYDPAWRDNHRLAHATRVPLDRSVSIIRRLEVHDHSREFPFLYLAMAISAENDRNERCDMFKGREKVPVLVDKEN
jgi:hypothetical protein